MWHENASQVSKFLATRPSHHGDSARMRAIQRNYQYYLNYNQFYLGTALEDGQPALISGYDPDKLVGLIGNHPSANVPQLIFNLVEANQAPDSRIVTTSPKIFRHKMEESKIVDVHHGSNMTKMLGSLAQEIYASGEVSKNPIICNAIIVLHELANLLESKKDIEVLNWILRNSTYFGYLTVATITLGDSASNVAEYFGDSLNPIIIGGMDLQGRQKGSNYFVGVESYSDMSTIVEFSV